MGIFIFRITDALMAATPFLFFEGSGGARLTLPEVIWDPVAYVRVRDSIYYSILDSSDLQLAPAREIIQRIQRRDLYKLVQETNPLEQVTESESGCSK